MPDAELFSAADAGTLAEPAALSTQAARLLSSPLAAEAIASFHTQWLGDADLLETQKDPADLPDFRRGPRARHAAGDYLLHAFGGARG